MTEKEKHDAQRKIERDLLRLYKKMMYEIQILEIKHGTMIILKKPEIMILKKL